VGNSSGTQDAPIRLAKANDPAGVNWRQVAAVAGGVALTLGIKGFIDGYSEETSSAQMSDKIKSGLVTGAIYATGVGYVTTQLKKR
jgi:Na+/H+ antiporter NhaA